MTMTVDLAVRENSSADEKGYVHEVVITYGNDVIARHERSYEREAVVFDPLHYWR